MQPASGQLTYHSYNEEITMLEIEIHYTYQNNITNSGHICYEGLVVVVP